MSSIDALSSSDAEATLSTLSEASPEAFSATLTRELVSAGDRGQARRGRPHLAGSVVQLVERLVDQALEFADIAFDGALARGGAGMALALLLFDPELVGGLLLEGIQRAGKRPDLVATLRISGVDGQIAGGHLQHRIAHGVQRPDHAAADGRHGAEGQGERGGQKHQLQHQRALGFGMLGQGIVLGGVERAFSDGDRTAHMFDRERAPFVPLHFGLLAGLQGVHQSIAKRQEIGGKIGGFRPGHRLDETSR
jgi:hypothetical protein